MSPNQKQERAVFLTRLWKILPELAPSIAWNASGQYLVIHDTDRLLKELQAARIVKSAKEASLGRQFRASGRSISSICPNTDADKQQIYGFSTIRQSVIKQTREFPNCATKAWILKHPTLTRDSPFHRVQIEAAAVLQKRRKAASKPDTDDDVTLQNSQSPSDGNALVNWLNCNLQNGTLAALLRNTDSAAESNLDSSPVAEAIPRSALVASPIGAAVQGFYTEEVPNDGMRLSIPDNAYLDNLLAGSFETEGIETDTNNAEQSELPDPVSDLQCCSWQSTGGNSCRTPLVDVPVRLHSAPVETVSSPSAAPLQHCMSTYACDNASYSYASAETCQLYPLMMAGLFERNTMG